MEYRGYCEALGRKARIADERELGKALPETWNARVGREGGPVPSDTASAIMRALDGGRPLIDPLQERLGAALGYHLGELRIHNDSEADQLSRALGADAFTIGTHVFFRRDTCDPHTREGRELIAHEVVHVLQQCTGRVLGGRNGITVQAADDAFEREAAALAPALASADCAAPTYPLPPLPRCRPMVVQRNAQRMIQAAMNQINPLTAESASTKPLNCHEAVLGWLLTSMGYPRRWRLIRNAARTHGVGNPLQFQGDWMWREIYRQRLPLMRLTVSAASPGDILCSGVEGRPTHSMVVVSKRMGAHNQVIVNIRGFNNAGTFITLLPAPGYMAYDNVDRNVADPALWGMANQPADCFGPAAGRLFWVRYETARHNAARMFPWENSPIPSRATPRWHYNPIQGWRWF